MGRAGACGSRRSTSRDGADTLRGAYLELVVRPDEDLARGSYYWHEVIGCAVRGVDGAELGTVKDIYRIGETEVFTVDGGPVASFDLPAVRAFIRIFAPRRGEIVVDAESLDLRPARSRTPDPDRPKAPRRRTRKPQADGRAADRPARCAIGRPTRRRTGRGAMTLEIDILTLFPAMVAGPLTESIPGRIQDQGLAAITVRDLRDWGLGRHRSVDDAPYGGGAGMILRPEPVASALDDLRRRISLVILLDPVGEVFRQARAVDLATRSHPSSICPRYEGVDERDPRAPGRPRVSIGDYVLTPAASCRRWWSSMRSCGGSRAPGGHRSLRSRISDGLLEYPQYTRPAEFRGMDVPDILTSGDHGEVARWRHDAATGETRERSATSSTPSTRRLPSTSAMLYSAADARPRHFRCPPAATAAQMSQERPVTVLDEIVKDQLEPTCRNSPRRHRQASRQGRRGQPRAHPGLRRRPSCACAAAASRAPSPSAGSRPGSGSSAPSRSTRPRIEKIEVVRHGVARRAQLYFLRDRVGKAATLRERRTNG